jgi:hypothetical protein
MILDIPLEGFGIMEKWKKSSKKSIPDKSIFLRSIYAIIHSSGG